MSMLAEPRRKQKVINLRAKNSIWSNDPNKFGQKMLEKMGWSTGKGLGANEDGIVEHVVALYKNDEKGFGYEDRNDQWTKHEDDFNALLANLSNDTESTEKIHSGISLEVKSKKSKTRVHYHKFTRGKDVSRYSEKDLANIFGKKTLKKVEPVEEIHQNKNVKITEQIFKVSGSMDDYFKNKFSALRTRISKAPETYDNDLDFGFKGFEGTENGNSEENHIESNSSFQPFSFYNNEIKSCEKNDDTFSEIKLKKKKKNKNIDVNVVENENVIKNINSDMNSAPLKVISEITVIKKKKHKKGKKQPDLISENDEISNTTEVVNDKNVTERKSKKKSKKLKISDESTSNDSKNFLETNKNKKKRKNEHDGINNEDASLVEEVTVPKKKKKRKQNVF